MQILSCLLSLGELETSTYYILLPSIILSQSRESFQYTNAIMRRTKNDINEVYKENYLKLFSKPASPFISPSYSTDFIENQNKSYRIESNIPKTKNLKVYCVTLSRFKSMQIATVHTVNYRSFKYYQRNLHSKSPIYGSRLRQLKLCIEK